MGDSTAVRPDNGGSVTSAIAVLLELAGRDDLDSSSRQALLDAAGHLRGSDGTAATSPGGLLDAIPDAVTIHDQRGDVIDANTAACRLYGHPRGTLLTLNLVDLSPALTSDHIEHVIETCRISDAFTVETSIRRSDGRNFPVEIHANAYEEGGETRVISIARGISHWQRTASALRDADQRYQTLLRSIDKGVYVCEARGGAAYANPAALQMLQMTEEAFAQAARDGFPGWQWHDERGRPLDAAEYPSARAFASGKPGQSELLCLSIPHRREPLWLSLTSVPLFRAGEETPYQVVVACDDVTELKRMRDVLARTQVVGSIGGFELSLDRKRLICTDEMYRLFDLPHDMPITLERLSSLLAPYDPDVMEDHIQAVVRGENVQHEHEIVTPLGRHRWLSIVLRPLRSGNAVQGVAGMCQDITARKLLEIELRRKAITDPLTGLANRESIVDELNRQIIATRPGESGPSLLYVDLDRFKTVNDILGAAAGDGLIAAAAERLRESLPDGARCGRFASDEFLVVLPRLLRGERASELAETIVQRFRRPFQHLGEDYVVTASVGLARHPKDGVTVQTLVRHADAAMSDAKRRGRNTWQAFSIDMERQLENSLEIENQLRHALERHELHLAYQPQVDMGTGRLVGAEALLRWRHPQRGELLPLAFVPHAENSGEIVPIGSWVIQEACRRLSEWRDEGIALPRIAVNVAYRQLLSEGFLDLVVGTLRRHDLPGDVLEIEMIERMLIEDTPETLQVLKDLRGLGVRVLIDDFGEGYSSLNYLRRLPIDALKISGEFVRRAPGAAADLAICEAIVRVGRGLELDLIAEGVETDEQRQLLLAQGLRIGQGNFFCPAVDAETFVSFARRRGFG